jgi:response regulator of citrate/malate metabolism
MTGAPTRVLVVEDEAAAARVLMDEVGAAAGFVVAGHTCSGATALRRVVSDDEVDLVLLDIQLPDISGMDVLRRLRAAGCDVDVMAVTVLRDPSMLQAAMALGVVHYLLKPFTAATVRQKLEHYQVFRARRLEVSGHAVAQQDVDEIFNALRAMTVDADSGLAKRGSRYGGAGRPEVEYRWSGDEPDRLPFSIPDVCPGSPSR